MTDTLPLDVEMPIDNTLSQEVIERVYKAQCATLEQAIEAVIRPTLDAGGGGQLVAAQLEVVVANVICMFVAPKDYREVATGLAGNVVGILVKHIMKDIPPAGSA